MASPTPGVERFYSYHIDQGDTAHAHSTHAFHPSVASRGPRTSMQNDSVPARGGTTSADSTGLLAQQLHSMRTAAERALAASASRLAAVSRREAAASARAAELATRVSMLERALVIQHALSADPGAFGVPSPPRDAFLEAAAIAAVKEDRAACDAIAVAVDAAAAAILGTQPIRPAHHEFTIPASKADVYGPAVPPPAPASAASATPNAPQVVPKAASMAFKNHGPAAARTPNAPTVAFVLPRLSSPPLLDCVQDPAAGEADCTATVGAMTAYLQEQAAVAAAAQSLSPCDVAVSAAVLLEAFVAVSTVAARSWAACARHSDSTAGRFDTADDDIGLQGKVECCTGIAEILGLLHATVPAATKLAAASTGSDALTVNPGLSSAGFTSGVSARVRECAHSLAETQQLRLYRSAQRESPCTSQVSDVAAAPLSVASHVGARVDVAHLLNRAADAGTSVAHRAADVRSTGFVVDAAASFPPACVASTGTGEFGLRSGSHYSFGLSHSLSTGKDGPPTSAREDQRAQQQLSGSAHSAADAHAAPTSLRTGATPFTDVDGSALRASGFDSNAVFSDDHEDHDLFDGHVGHASVKFDDDNAAHGGNTTSEVVFFPNCSDGDSSGADVGADASVSDSAPVFPAQLEDSAAADDTNLLVDVAADAGPAQSESPLYSPSEPDSPPPHLAPTLVAEAPRSPSPSLSQHSARSASRRASPTPASPVRHAFPWRGGAGGSSAGSVATTIVPAGSGFLTPGRLLCAPAVSVRRYIEPAPTLAPVVAPMPTYSPAPISVDAPLGAGPAPETSADSRAHAPSHSHPRSRPLLTPSAAANVTSQRMSSMSPSSRARPGTAVALGHSGIPTPTRRRVSAVATDMASAAGAKGSYVNPDAADDGVSGTAGFVTDAQGVGRTGPAASAATHALPARQRTPVRNAAGRAPPGIIASVGADAVPAPASHQRVLPRHDQAPCTPAGDARAFGVRASGSGVRGGSGSRDRRCGRGGSVFQRLSSPSASTVRRTAATAAAASAAAASSTEASELRPTWSVASPSRSRGPAAASPMTPPPPPLASQPGSRSRRGKPGPTVLPMLPMPNLVVLGGATAAETLAVDVAPLVEMPSPAAAAAAAAAAATAWAPVGGRSSPHSVLGALPLFPALGPTPEVTDALAGPVDAEVCEPQGSSSMV